ncbi:hypothetical protein ACE38W_14695 [Chitinophaga sp. Hz27]|uniref:hypothetical protein n=1 Tax=Chitinophaga sp. Hz27 TaxID=3347169 RepID=UPI0035D80508
MKGESLTLVSNGYIVISFHCKDKRLRFPTGQKAGDNSTKALRKIEAVKKAVDDYVFQYTSRAIDIIHDELKTYLDNKFRPDQKKKIANRDLIADHKAMIADMESGALLKPKSKTRYSKASILHYDSMRKVWEDCAADPTSEFVLNYDMTLTLFNNLVKWMMLNGYKQNSMSCVVNCLEIFFRYTAGLGYHQNDVYKHKDFTVPNEESDAIAPTFDEVKAIYNLQLKGIRERVRDFFVYGCFLALRVKDLKRINKYIPNGRFMEVYTSKGSKKVTIPLHWIAKEIYEKYEGRIPIPCLSSLYNHIPEIAKVAGVTGKKLKTYTQGGIKKEQYFERADMFRPHSMRRFFATWMYKDLRRQPREIMLITGHSSEDSFFKYIKIEAEENALEILNDPAFCKKE